ncbi:nucleic acid-binding, OB-fold protein [Artemisia annua]|uniref:Nucleic acid-binding, OB-fold protein n=1 Tax=Artemisia annua TaxID=35608 RepID=A0A2U1P4U9_ARTAN|nr:nucleic acid-binding, OB-fold protein [Artemisia annua]
MADKEKEPATQTTAQGLPTHDEPTPQRSKDKGKAPMVEREEPNLMDIKPSDLDKPIGVKVYRFCHPGECAAVGYVTVRFGPANSGNVLTFTMWNEMATNFPLETLGELEQPVVIAVSSCWARRFPGGLQLSATPATNYYLNPRVEEANHIRQMYNEMMLPTPPLQIPPTSTQLAEHAPARQLTPLNVLMQASPESVVQQFTTQATIIGIDEQMGWYFNRCQTCGNKISETMPHRQCQQPGVKPIPN